MTLLSGVVLGCAINVTYGYLVAHEDGNLAGIEILISDPGRCS